MDRKRPTPEGDGRMHMEGTSNTVSYGRGKKTLVHLSICPWLFVHARSSIALWCCSFLVLVCAPAFASLDTLERQVHEDLKKLNIPGKQWTRHPACFCGPPPLDVAIIGSGMAGNTVALALAKEGIVNIRIFDANPEGNEGSWNTYARMKQLRSNKRLAGPSAGIPSLTFRAWYLATRGHGAWEVLGFIPTGTWGDYLRWYRKVLRLPVANEVTLKKITPHNGWLELTVEEGAATKTYLARKVVLATGMEGFGGNVIPPYMSDVPKNFYATAYEPIAPACLKEKRIAVIGAGASAFDATAFALENGAHRVDMMVRRKKIPLTDKLSQFSDRGIQHGFYSLSDDIRCRFFA
ncbi:MAG: FAD/NAD(P)-binding protein [Parachlamydiaceae bacterium]